MASDSLSIWKRWRALATKAAYVQSHVLMWLLYFVAFLPLALLQRLAADPLDRRLSTPPVWRPREDNCSDLARARRQF